MPLRVAAMWTLIKNPSQCRGLDSSVTFLSDQGSIFFFLHSAVGSSLRSC